MKRRDLILKAALIIGLFAGRAAASPNQSEIFVLTNSSITVNGSTSTWMGTSQAEFYTADFYVSVTTFTGTSTPTMTPVIQLSPDSGATWFTHPSSTFTAINSTTTVVKFDNYVGGATDVRLSYTLTGTNPMFRTKVWGVVRKK